MARGYLHVRIMIKAIERGQTIHYQSSSKIEGQIIIIGNSDVIISFDIA